MRHATQHPKKIEASLRGSQPKGGWAKKFKRRILVVWREKYRCEGLTPQEHLVRAIKGEINRALPKGICNFRMWLEKGRIKLEHQDHRGRWWETSLPRELTMTETPFSFKPFGLDFQHRWELDLSWSGQKGFAKDFKRERF